ncbi:MAG TPA: DUF983 domain-containing protein [Acidimicrobiia bacterium]
MTTAPSPARILWWGCTRRCPSCGAGHLFRRWFVLRPECQSCGLHFEREEGYWTGALAINIGVAGFVFLLVFVPWVALTVPDVPVGPILAVLVPLMMVVPIVAYPRSKTLWMAVDHAFLQRLDRA